MSSATAPAASSAAALRPDTTAPVLLEADFVVARRSFPVALELSLCEGERFSLFGTSGAGKTTCLEAIAGWARLERGQVTLDGHVVNTAGRGRGRSAVDPPSRRVALVRQPTTLFPHMSVRANVGYGLRRAESRDSRLIDSLLEKVGLDGLGAATPDALSGGQRQRAAIARALLRPFRALLLDEPFSAVDAAGRGGLRRLASDEASAGAAAAVLVTHDLAEAQAFGHRLGIMDGGELLQVGSPDEVVRCPATVRVADLCGYRSYLARTDGGAWALHPDRFVDGSAPDRGIELTGRVRSIEPHGPLYACEMAVSDGGLAPAVVVRVHTGSPPPVGELWTVTAVDPPVVRGATAATERKG